MTTSGKSPDLCEHFSARPRRAGRRPRRREKAQDNANPAYKRQIPHVPRSLRLDRRFYSSLLIAMPARVSMFLDIAVEFASMMRHSVRLLYKWSLERTHWR